MSTTIDQLSDRDLIERVLNAYAMAYDDDDMDVMADTMTPDAVMTLRIADGDVIGPFDGREAILKLMKDSHASQTDQRRHLVSNMVIRELTGSSARVDSYLTLISIEDKKLTVLTTARYEDELVKDGAAWRFRKRHIQLDLPY